MKTTRMITISLVSSALLGGLGFALVSLDVSLASLIKLSVGTFVTTGLFGFMLWDTGRAIDADEARTRSDALRNATTRPNHPTPFSHHTPLAGS